MKDARLYLIHILESAEKVEDYTRKGRDAFMDSPMTQDAVVRNFEVIGEAVKEVIPKRSPNPRYTLIGAFNSRVSTI